LVVAHFFESASKKKERREGGKGGRGGRRSSSFHHSVHICDLRKGLGGKKRGAPQEEKGGKEKKKAREHSTDSSISNSSFVSVLYRSPVAEEGGGRAPEGKEGGEEMTCYNIFIRSVSLEFRNVEKGEGGKRLT